MLPYSYKIFFCMKIMKGTFMMRQQCMITRALMHPHTRLMLESGQNAENKQIVFLFPSPEILFQKSFKC